MKDSAEAFAESCDVSRETLERLRIYAELLTKWTPAINLVSRGSLADLWSRHFLDSAQLFALSPVASGHWADLGSGGGFPGLVVAILAAETAPGLRFSLVESDLRKAAFLSTVARETGVSVDVIAERAEALPPLAADILSARAFAPLSALLGHAERHLTAEGRGLFPKGASYQAEIDEALASWRFDVQKTPSRTDPASVVLTIGGIARV